MRKQIAIVGVLALALGVVAGCGSESPAPKAAAGSAGQAAASPYRLTAEPAGAKDVAAARKAVKDGDAVALVGRIGGNAAPFVPGMTAFRVADLALKPCDDGCEVPWDFCCEPNLAESTALVKVVDASGNVVSGDAKQSLGVKELSTVVVQGKAKRDEQGNLTVLADGVYVREQ